LIAHRQVALGVAAMQSTGPRKQQYSLAVQRVHFVHWLSHLAPTHGTVPQHPSAPDGGCVGHVGPASAAVPASLLGAAESTVPALPSPSMK
jgi:hypothetical protein